ncbi:2-haloacid dehalogenase [Flexibacter flexilis DSM 6793]|uniref:2-haloacid dehalogenase n=1 Tax=Flexibacter flexilis DSM 6793 TaxID=927664 RepID=A0A1I1DIG1_9BACT|nr:haloacid dehalogenase type II [Flexibacter flexilis]SFB74624.1 2-haloacid dehalogenase [Flexibacter flexilis DSM 6793]
MNNRRTFLKKSIPLGLLPFVPIAATAENETVTATANTLSKPKVIFFDVNETLLDLEPLKRSVVKTLGGQKELGSLWFTTMLKYSLVATVAGQYFDFGKIGAATLIMVAQNNGIVLTEEDAKNAVKPILSLQPHVEVKEALELLKQHKYTLISFTNSSNKAVAQQLKNAGIIQLFDGSISVEDYGKYKPDTEVYHWAARKMQVQNSDCMLVAAHGWDIAGALWAGWQGAFIARAGQQLFPLAPTPQINQKDLLKVAKEIVAL